MVGDQVSEPGGSAHASEPASLDGLIPPLPKQLTHGARPSGLHGAVSLVSATKKAHVTGPWQLWRRRQARALGYQKGSREPAIRLATADTGGATAFPNLLTHPGWGMHKPVMRGKWPAGHGRRRLGTSAAPEPDPGPSGSATLWCTREWICEVSVPLAERAAVPLSAHVPYQHSSPSFPRVLTNIPKRAHHRSHKSSPVWLQVLVTKGGSRR